MRKAKIGDIAEDKIFEAIREGVHDAIWQMITNATQNPCRHDFFDTIKDAVKESIENAMPPSSEIAKAVAESIKKAMPSSSEIANAITKGVLDAMPWPSEITGAIYEGTKDAT